MTTSSSLEALLSSKSLRMTIKLKTQLTVETMRTTRRFKTLLPAMPRTKDKSRRSAVRRSRRLRFSSKLKSIREEQLLLEEALMMMSSLKLTLELVMNSWQSEPGLAR